MLFKQTYKVIFIDFDPFYDNEDDDDENNDNVNHEYANDGIYGDVDVSTTLLMLMLAVVDKNMIILSVKMSEWQT